MTTCPIDETHDTTRISAPPTSTWLISDQIYITISIIILYICFVQDRGGLAALFTATFSAHRIINFRETERKDFWLDEKKLK